LGSALKSIIYPPSFASCLSQSYQVVAGSLDCLV
jgi:hypothetical protein